MVPTLLTPFSNNFCLEPFSSSILKLELNKLTLEAGTNQEKAAYFILTGVSTAGDVVVTD